MISHSQRLCWIHTWNAAYRCIQHFKEDMKGFQKPREQKWNDQERIVAFTKDLGRVARVLWEETDCTSLLLTQRTVSFVLTGLYKM